VTDPETHLIPLVVHATHMGELSACVPRIHIVRIVSNTWAFAQQNSVSPRNTLTRETAPNH